MILVEYIIYFIQFINIKELYLDKQGITGKKVEIYTIPFKSIIMYSSENAKGILDYNAEIEL